MVFSLGSTLANHFFKELPCAKLEYKANVLVNDLAELFLAERKEHILSTVLREKSVENACLNMLTTFSDSHYHPECLGEEYYAYEVPELLIHRINAASVTLPLSIIHLQDRSIWGDSLFAPTRFDLQLLNEKARVTGSSRIKIEDLPEVRLQGGVIPVYSYDRNYSHWFCDTIAVLSQLINVIIDRRLTILTHVLAEWQKESLAMLDERLLAQTMEIDMQCVVRPDYVITSNFFSTIAADRPCESSFAFANTTVSSKPFACDLADPPQCKSLQHKRPNVIYFSRRDTVLRTIRNEHKLIQLLEKEGVKIIEASSQSISQTKMDVGTADVIIAPHGAACQNIQYASSGALFIELTRDDWPAWAFMRLAAIKGLNYISLVIEGNEYNLDYVSNLVLYIMTGDLAHKRDFERERMSRLRRFSSLLSSRACALIRESNYLKSCVNDRDQLLRSHGVEI